MPFYTIGILFIILVLNKNNLLTFKRIFLFFILFIYRRWLFKNSYEFFYSILPI